MFIGEKRYGLDDRGYRQVNLNFMRKLHDQDHGFQVIYVSQDDDLPSFYGFISEMPCTWLTLPFDTEKAESLKELLHVYTEPCLVAFGPEGRLLTNNASIPLEDCGMNNKCKLYNYSFNEFYSEAEDGMHFIRAGLLWDGKEKEAGDLVPNRR